MKTLRDAVQCVNGPGGAVICSMGPIERGEFAEIAEKLGRQIATDFAVAFEGDANIPPEMPLSDVAECLLNELMAIKLHLLAVGPTLYRRR